MNLYTTTFCVFAALLAAEPQPAAAAEIVLDEHTEGTVLDAILDGFPSLAPFDGKGDFGNNALGVALQAGVTEERAIVEYPLAALDGIHPHAIVSATLVFNIDDVVSTFGPGTGFDGTAADTILVYDFAGNGEVTTDDFLEAIPPALAAMSTQGRGVITDASLAASGPLFFDVDVTAAVVDRLESGDAFAGFLFATDDNKTATSLDDLGNSSAGPPGVGGSRKPVLTIVVADATTTTSTSTSTTSTTEEPLSRCGDINGDGKVSASEALFILRVAVGLQTCTLAMCDVDGSGKVNAADALRALRISVGVDLPLLCDSTA